MEVKEFTISDKSQLQIMDAFTYHKPKDEEVSARCQHVRDQFKALAWEIVRWVPESRELSMALTNLEHASMDAIAGIVRHQNE